MLILEAQGHLYVTEALAVSASKSSYDRTNNPLEAVHVLELCCLSNKKNKNLSNDLLFHHSHVHSTKHTHTYTLTNVQYAQVGLLTQQI